MVQAEMFVFFFFFFFRCCFFLSLPFLSCLASLSQPSLQWHNYDDSSVSKTNAANVVSDAAYVLFYKRRDAWGDHSEIGNEKENEEKEGQDQTEEENKEEEGETEKNQKREEEKEAEAPVLENGDTEGGESFPDPNDKGWQGVETGLFT